MSQQIQLRHDTSANWSSVNPIMAIGEAGIDTTLNKIKIGDGSTAWNSLLFLSSDATGALLTANNLSDLADISVARTNLGLGSAALSSASAFDASGAATSAVATHVGLSNPHSQYLQPSDNLFVTPQVVIVKTANAGAGEFTSLSLAVASITDSDPVTKPYIIYMGAGVHTVNNPIILPSGVSVKGEGINSTRVIPQNVNAHLFVLGLLSEISFLNLKGASGSIGSGKAAIYCEDIGSSGFGQIHKVSIYDFDIAIDNYANTADSTVFAEYIDFNGDFTFGTRTRSNGAFVASTQLENFYTYASAGTTPIHVFVTGTNSLVILNSTGISGGANNRGIVVSDGAHVTISDTLIKDFSSTNGKAFISENTGSGPIIDLSGTTFANNTKDISIDNPNTTGAISATADKSKTTVNDTSPITVFLSDTQAGGITMTGELNYSSDNFSDAVNIGPLITSSFTTGVFSGGQLSVGSGLILNVSALKGYVTTGTPPNEIVKYYQITSQTIAISASSDNYVYINSSGTLVQNAAAPDTTSNILLGRVVTDATNIIFIEKAPLASNHYSNKIDKVFREAIGSIYAAGSLVSENGSMGLNVTAGEYYFSENEFLPTGGTNISWSSFYLSAVAGIYTKVNNVSVVDNGFFDNGSGTLAAIPSGRYAKHLLLIIGGPSEQYSMVYATAHYLTLAEAQAADLPIAPNFMFGAFARVASLIVNTINTNLLDIIDERPRIGFASSSSVGGVTSHSALSGLSNDDHTQYLLANGSRSLVGNLNMNGNSITNINLVDGIDVTAHATRHLPNGADPIATGTPSSVGTSNSEGIANAIARQDHIHDHGSQSVGTHHAAVSTTVNGFMSFTDKIKLNLVSNTELGFLSGVSSAIQTQFSNKEPSVTATSSADYYRGDKTFVPLNKTAVGLSNVDNTSDVNKPVSSDTQTALNLKYDSSNPSSYETTSQLNTRDTNNRDRANHTNTQLAATISDFAATVLSTVLTGISFVTSTAVLATDSILIAIGKLQSQLNLEKNLVVVTALNNTSNVTLTNITDLTFPVTAGKRYRIKTQIFYRTAITTTGITFTKTNTTAVGTLSLMVQTLTGSGSNTVGFFGNITAFGGLFTSTGVQAANTDYILNADGIFVCTTSGTITPQFRSEVNASQVTVGIGSNISVREF